MNSVLPEVAVLLGQYNDYKKLLATSNEIDRKLAKAKVLKINQSSLQAEKNEVLQQLQALSDKMTFANPLIWIQYKYLAYADEAQPINTMHDLRVHCSKPGYICTKRYTFLNSYLIGNGNAPLSDQQTYQDDLPLLELLDTKSLRALTNDTSFKEQWRAFEYFTKDGMVAKWENYTNEY